VRTDAGSDEAHLLELVDIDQMDTVRKHVGDIEDAAVWCNRR